MTGYLAAVNDALERLDDLGYERRVGGGDLANHGPMAAEALALLGHGDRIPAWVRTYRELAPHHEPPVPYQRLDGTDEADWQAALGHIGRAGDFEELIAREIDNDGWRTALTRWWPRLLAGPMTGLTHGLIRTAHAVRSISAAPTPSHLQLTELARGLGFWASLFIGSPGPGRLTGRLGVSEAIAATARPERVPDGPGEAESILRQPDSILGYRDALHALEAGDAQRLLSDMTAEFAGLCVVHSGEGFPVPLVHAVTAPAAARLVMPWLPPEQHELTVAAVWQAQVTLLMLTTTTQRGEREAYTRGVDYEAPSWDVLVEGAVEHGDEHVIKFTEACLREHMLRPDPRYGWAVHTAQQTLERPVSASRPL